MRRVLLALAVLAVAASGCVTPPAATNPYACGDDPVDLGPGRLEAMSADGRILAVSATPAAGEGVRYEVIDRRRGQRHDVTTTSPLGDGAALFMDAAGTRIYGLRYPALAEGESVWFLHDVASRVTLDIAPLLEDFAAPFAFADDLATAALRPGTGAPWELLDVDTGGRTPLGLIADPAWRTAAFSPDLSKVVQYSSAWSNRKSVRVLDTVTGSLVLDVGQVRNENLSYVATRFVDGRTLLVDDAEPAGSSADAIANDGAFLVDLVDGTLTRLDPGVAGASTSSASPDGSRSVFALVPGSQTWLRVDGTNQAVSEGYGALASLDHRVLVTDGDGRVTLRCVA